jgi:hypothetical protein
VVTEEEILGEKQAANQQLQNAAIQGGLAGICGDISSLQHMIYRSLGMKTTFVWNFKELESETLVKFLRLASTLSSIRCTICYRFDDDCVLASGVHMQAL